MINIPFLDWYKLFALSTRNVTDMRYEIPNIVLYVHLDEMRISRKANEITMCHDLVEIIYRRLL